MRFGSQRRSSNVEDRRGQGGGLRLGRGGLAGVIPLLLVRLLFSRLGRKTMLPLVLIAGAALAAYIYVQPFRTVVNSVLASQGVSLPGVAPSQQAAPDTDAGDPDTRFAGDDLADFSAATLGSTEDVWTALFAANNEIYDPPTLVFYEGGTTTECGLGQSAMGPFYCPADERIYIDLEFFRSMEAELGAGGDFAWAYVIAHEVGHHIQKEMGVLDWSRNRQNQLGGRGSADANEIQVRVELMADCLAGVWAGQAEAYSDVALEAGDIREAIEAAEAVGDDTLQRRAGGQVVPDSFTHGSSEQRMRWFQRGYDGGDRDQCDTRFIPEAQL